MSAPFAVYGTALGGSCRQIKLELDKTRAGGDGGIRTLDTALDRITV